MLRRSHKVAAFTDVEHLRIGGCWLETAFDEIAMPPRHPAARFPQPAFWRAPSGRSVHRAFRSQVDVEFPGIADFLDQPIPSEGLRGTVHFRLEHPAVSPRTQFGQRLIAQKLRWTPSSSLRAGMEVTYAWIAAQVKAGRQSVGKPGQATFPVTPTAP